MRYLNHVLHLSTIQRNPSWICVISAQGLKSKHQSDIAQNSNELNLNGA